MGLIISVYRNPDGDFTKGGISSKSTELYLENVHGPSTGNGRPVAYLVKGNISGTAKIVPAEMTDDGKVQPTNQWTMMGGNYGATSDSRFSEAVERIIGHKFYGAVPIHDRIE